MCVCVCVCKEWRCVCTKAHRHTRMHAHARAHTHVYLWGQRRHKALLLQSLTDLFTDLVLVSFFLGTSRGGRGLGDCRLIGYD